MHLIVGADELEKGRGIFAEGMFIHLARLTAIEPLGMSTGHREFTLNKSATRKLPNSHHGVVGLGEPACR